VLDTDRRRNRGGAGWGGGTCGQLGDFGWNTVDSGTIESSRYLEGMCLVWVLYGLATGTWNHAFKLLRK
jgi:hypothetical protein